MIVSIVEHVQWSGGRSMAAPAAGWAGREDREGFGALLRWRAALRIRVDRKGVNQVGRKDAMF